MNAKSIRLPGLALLTLAIALPLQAQDPAKVAPDMYNCTFENEHARLCEVTIEAGAKIASHSHPQHMLYVLAPGKARIHPEGGEAVEVDFAPGQAIWANAETHHAENIGGTEVKLLVIEFKALKDSAKAKDSKDKDMDMGDAAKK